MIKIVEGIHELLSQEREFDFAPSDYAEIRQRVRLFVKSMRKPADKLLAFDYALFVFRTEYAARTRTRLFRWNNPESIKYLWPKSYYTEDGSEQSLTCCGQKEIQLDENVAVAAWHPCRLRRILPIIKRDEFIEDSESHTAYYYPEIDLATVESGNHSASAGVFFKSGTVHADVYPISRMFEHVTTSGSNWTNKHTGKKLGDVTDPYIALLYEIAQAKYEFLKEHPELA